MKFLAIFTAFVMGAIVQATPVSNAEQKTVLTETEFGTSMENAFDSSTLVHSGEFQFESLASNNTGIARIEELAKRSEATIPVLVVCSRANCGGNCQSYKIVGEYLDVCTRPSVPNPFYSTFINNPSYYKLLFQVDISASNGCNGLTRIPKTNVCYNISPAGRTWELLKGTTY